MESFKRNIKDYMNEDFLTEIMCVRIDFEDEPDEFINFTIMNMDDEGEQVLMYSKN